MKSNGFPSFLSSLCCYSLIKNLYKSFKNNSYPSFFISSFGIKRNAALLMQYRKPPFSMGPSVNTWPKWAFPHLLLTSVRIILWLKSSYSWSTLGSIGFVKLGQPQPDWNLSVEQIKEKLVQAWDIRNDFGQSIIWSELWKSEKVLRNRNDWVGSFSKIGNHEQMAEIKQHMSCGRTTI